MAKTMRAEQRTEFDSQGRARWVLTWMEADGSRGQVWFGTPEAMLLMLARNGFKADALAVKPLDLLRG
jgi:hypothetical protein